jgi:hypothetical protein
VIVILTRPQPVRLLAAFLIGGMATSVIVGFVLLKVIDGTGIATGDTGRSVGPGIDIAAGLASLALAFALATGRELPFAERRAARKRKREAAKALEDRKDPWTKRILGRDSLWLAFALGVALDLPSVWYLAALKDIAQADHAVTIELALILTFNLIMFALIEVPLVCYLLAPERSAAAVDRFAAWAHSHARQIGAWVAGLIGAYLLISGILDLV